MRLFVAVDPSAVAVDHLGTRLARMRVAAATAAGLDVRLADPADLHVTVAFLGTVGADRLVELESALGLAASWFRAARQGVPRLRLGGGGRFGRDRSTVLWVDLRGDVEALHLLAGQVRTRLRHAGLAYDEKPFRPHLTIARPGDRMTPADIEADRAFLDGYEGPEWSASELLLMRSRPGSRPRYERIAAWAL
ncbi:RNA 2',3'-cyclic phosphodiesterase [Micromonospora sp. WMMD1120]|uniref:RNA 2',3'-cyclic phosphodiesterase n=1 Tax=Micromonospora sp. WMMD1120 TaxID=3016106 RepID=UPI002415AF0A|nr:RNA 2',3'-cyclic phosphodiesterase [Micromonospora sp. WMMD1120]MDG4807433.1 RNA 2',3'-cyclic phosphodiesterase [Micromonospora sp. WMMD1120]